ncbi:hypothetical protein KSB_86020 [Ktedonobacter robiniae]|uniref:Carrier domain-containing protein n=1 Tax=Ktedonobacter robiniae TaxID=2778365 RepID=A0ABQ3V583_9CHLR|nr:hypothetical protein KSB_86020 [Ktedonobacter robiniae]
MPLDARSPQARLASQLEACGAPVLLTQEAICDQLPQLPTTSVLVLERVQPALQDYGHENLQSVTRPEDLAYVLYTSGSTGQPKGVCLTQRNLLNYVLAMGDWLGGQVGWSYATVSTLAADLGNTAIYGALCWGGCLHVLGYETITSAEEMARWCAQTPIDVLKIVPSHLSALLRASDEPASVLPREALILGGEAVSASLLERLRASGAGCRIYNHYGPTESTIGVLVEPLGRGQAWDEAMRRTASVPLGRPLSNVEFLVLDRHQQVVGPGMQGELYLAGAGLARGYLGRGEQTAERFVPHPFSQEPGERLYRTGDVVRVGEGGAIHFVGRGDGQVKVRGYRVELGEIEAVLRAHPGVWEAVVQVWREDGKEEEVVGYVVRRKPQMVSRAQLREQVSQHLPEYMVPQRWVYLEQVPLTDNGKLDRRRLPGPEEEGEEREGGVVVRPRNALEEVIADCWREVLGGEELSVHENFFHLGGHSLLATQVMSRLRAVVQVELPITSLFEAPTVAGLAREVEKRLRGEQGGEMPVLEAKKRPERLPLSFAQRRLWFLDQLEPGGTAYLLPRALALRGPLNGGALDRSIQALIQRHEVLRTTFREYEEQPIQIIHSSDVFRIPFVDLSGLKNEEQERWLQRLIVQEAQQPLDLVQGPLLRVHLVKQAPDTHVLLLTMHHIMTDGWSNAIFVRELSTLYRAFAAGKPTPLAPLPIQYADFALWQQQWLQGEVFDAQVDYWIQQLRDVPPLELPTDHARPPVQTFHGALAFAMLPASLHEELKALSQREGVTLFMLLLASFQVLLARYSRQTDIAVGTPIANRTNQQLEDLIGFFVNTLVMRADLSGNPTFHDLLGRVRGMALNAYAHQNVPFEKIVEMVQPERDLSRPPLFQIMFILQNGPTPSGELGNVRFDLLPAAIETAKFDLTLEIQSAAEGLHCRVEYNTDLFEQATIQRLLAHWQTLLTGIVAQPTQPIADLPLLTVQEQQQALYTWNEKTRPFAHEVAVHQLIEQQVARTPDAVALCCDDEALTYERLNHWANALASTLMARGVGPDVPVAVLMERSIPFVVAMLAVFKANGVYLPLDPLQPAARLRQIMQQCQGAVVLTSTTFQSLLDELFDDAYKQIMPEILTIENIAASSPEPIANIISRHQPNHLAYIIYTSGSTGLPKGVMVEHQGMLNHLLAKMADVSLTATDTIAQNGPQGFDISLWQSLAALTLGGKVEVFRNEVAFDAARLLQQIEERAVSILQVVPSMIRGMLSERDGGASEHLTFSALRWLIPTGDALPNELCNRWFELYPAIPLLNTYGSTECSDDQCHFTITGPMRAEQERPIVPIGFPIPNMQVYVLDQAMHVAPVGVIGELYVGGIGVGRGYLADPVRTAQAFVPNPFGSHAGERLYKTGDLVRYLTDGNIEFLGRRDNLVKLRGYRIELGDIEAVLAQNAKVHDSVVIVRQNSKVSQDSKTLIAYVVAKENAELSRSELEQHVRGKLPEYMLPSSMVFLDELPLNANGKIDRQALPEPEMRDEQTGREHIAARTPIEEVVAVIWSEVLAVRPVSIEANFFSLGGHSLLATRVVARLRSAFAIDLPLRSLFEAPTIAGLARRIECELHGGQRVEIPPYSQCHASKKYRSRSRSGGSGSCNSFSQRAQRI